MTAWIFLQRITLFSNGYYLNSIMSLYPSLEDMVVDQMMQVPEIIFNDFCIHGCYYSRFSSLLYHQVSLILPAQHLLCFHQLQLLQQLQWPMSHILVWQNIWDWNYQKKLSEQICRNIYLETNCRWILRYSTLVMFYPHSSHYCTFHWEPLKPLVSHGSTDRISSIPAVMFWWLVLGPG